MALAKNVARDIRRSLEGVRGSRNCSPGGNRSNRSTKDSWDDNVLDPELQHKSNTVGVTIGVYGTASGMCDCMLNVVDEVQCSTAQVNRTKPCVRAKMQDHTRHCCISLSGTL